ncbi:GntR family transcriptional regulator, partial [Propionicimonas sp.]|uniref:GntR family transcriptional regulator n=1 Tax=Propionicimonas sp. TaxID=1955623 RepID=UPI0039E58B6F
MTVPATSAARLVQLLGRRDQGVPAYRWLADGLRRVVTDGRVPAGHGLPSERRLSEALGASRTTVTRAYAILVESGFLVARHGSGHVVTLPLGRERWGVGGALLPGTGDSEDVLDLTCAACRAPAGTA